MNIYESAEDYLEAILILRERQGTVRSIDVVHQLELTKPSVSVAMKNLKNKSYIDISGAGHITLSEAGLKLAAEIYERHTVLTDWLISLGVDPKVAAEDACKMEHDISTQSFEAMKRFIQNRL